VFSAGGTNIAAALHDKNLATVGAFVGLDRNAVALGAVYGLAVVFFMVIAELGHGHGEFIFAGIVGADEPDAAGDVGVVGGPVIPGKDAGDDQDHRSSADGNLFLPLGHGLLSLFHSRAIGWVMRTPLTSQRSFCKYHCTCPSQNSTLLPLL
jgi:hypothetical protein